MKDSTSKVGLKGENLFYNVMTQRGHQVEDVTKDESYWYKDIDFLVDGYAFEVKSYQKPIKSLWIEQICFIRDGRGWFQFTQADYICFIDLASRQMYIFPKQEINKILQNAALCTYGIRYNNGICDLIDLEKLLEHRDDYMFQILNFQ